MKRTKDHSVKVVVVLVILWAGHTAFVFVRAIQKDGLHTRHCIFLFDDRTSKIMIFAYCTVYSAVLVFFFVLNGFRLRSSQKEFGRSKLTPAEHKFI
jgi:hypothetical protein